MPHLPLAMWYFRGSAPYLREYVDFVNHNLFVEMTISIGRCLRGLAHSNLWVRVNYNKHSLNLTIKRTEQY